MKQLLRRVRQHKVIVLLALAIAAGLILQLTKQQSWANWLLGAVAITAVIALLWEAWQTLKHGGVGIDILPAITLVTAVVIGEYWTAVVIVIVVLLTKQLYRRAEQLVRYGFSSTAQLPKTASVTRKGKSLTLPVSELRIGDKVTIAAGETIPVDAVLVQGTTTTDESRLTGDGQLQPKHADEQLLAGTINVGDEIIIKVTATAADSQYQRLLKRGKQISVDQAPFVRLANRYSLPFTFMALAIATAMWVLSGEALRFLQVLVVATPFPLLSASLALLGGLGRARRYGIVIKNGAVLERLADTATLAFAKASLVSASGIKITAIKSLGGQSDTDVLGLVASLLPPTDQLAETALAEARTRTIKLAKVKHAKVLNGGAAAQLKGQTVLVGRQSLLKQEGIDIPAKLAAASADTQVYAAINGEVAGRISFANAAAPEAQATVQQLAGLGLKNLTLLTEDDEHTAQALAKQLGINNVRANARSADTLHFFDSVTERPLTFVGTDAAALHAADVGITLNGRDSGLAGADVTIMNDSVGKVAQAVQFAQRSLRLAQLGVWSGVALSLGLMGIFATGKIDAIIGASLQIFIVVIVLMLALRSRKLQPLNIHQ